MGIPLIIIGTLGGKFIPQSGPWMNTIKNFSAFIMLGLAIWILERVIPGALALGLWSYLFIVSAIYIGALCPSEKTMFGKFKRALAILLLMYGGILLIGASFGNDNIFQPLKGIQHRQNQVSDSDIDFQPVKSIKEVNLYLQRAKSAKKKVMLDFYADWCTSCIEYKRFVFNQATVKAALRDYALLQADVTKQDSQDRQLMQHFKVIAPPTLIFFDQQGAEMNGRRIIGYKNATAFIKHLGK
jgi:thiol:disulfide interchange protein DsbD